ncbi:hypothetical protein LCGC14_0593540 [marine sediment metagenome]|uniref:Uncharacterized protein n=1 Tax=marine sediment metagenome TaxID=412755 RepID=A0A0F9RHM8_9ZZZZ
MNSVKIISTETNELTQRVAKFLRFGLKDVQTAIQTAPYGVDSNPIKDMVAIYGTTSDKGKPVIIGYINKNQLADIGETRIFSTDASGTLKTYIWLQNDGIMEVGGSVDNMVRFSDLETGFNQLKSDFNAFLVHVHGAAGTPPVPLATPSTASIAGSKINEIKTL